jgi:hypothetical protein
MSAGPKILAGGGASIRMEGRGAAEAGGALSGRGTEIDPSAPPHLIVALRLVGRALVGRRLAMARWIPPAASMAAAASTAAAAARG